MKRSSTSAKASSPARNEGDEDDDEEFAQFAVSKNRQRDRKDRKKSRKRKSMPAVMTKRIALSTSKWKSLASKETNLMENWNLWEKTNHNNYK